MQQLLPTTSGKSTCAFDWAKPHADYTVSTMITGKWPKVIWYDDDVYYPVPPTPHLTMPYAVITLYNGGAIKFFIVDKRHPGGTKVKHHIPKKYTAKLRHKIMMLDAAKGANGDARIKRFGSRVAYPNHWPVPHVEYKVCL